ncbi:TadE/TadG family type IV pilus assembly protein [Nocardioides litoris]|uniref:TadE/TadG family type IV pilus assembly protein n=1 Tax=Nocardioides litoris TaxID=1926648 RepID=UPI00112100C5|nr:TadE/TadG family type IV pilus assembly protein [Nocardioides litoris]
MVGRRGRRARGRDRDRGAAALEFALVVPFLLLLLLGIISYGMMLSFRQSMSQAATEGARAAAVTIDPSKRKSEGYAAVQEALSAFDVRCDSGNVVVDGADAGDCSVTSPGPCTPAAAAGVQCVTVTVTYRYRDFPLVPNFPGVGVVIPETLSYSAQARVS